MLSMPILLESLNMYYREDSWEKLEGLAFNNLKLTQVETDGEMLIRTSARQEMIVAKDAG